MKKLLSPAVCSPVSSGLAPRIGAGWARPAEPVSTPSALAYAELADRQSAWPTHRIRWFLLLQNAGTRPSR